MGITRNLFKLVHFRTPPPNPRSNIWWPLKQLRSSRRYASRRNSFLCFLPSATKLRRLCFYRCLSVHRGGVVSQHALQVVSQHALQQVSRGGASSRGVPAPGGACSGRVPAPWGELLQGGACSREVETPPVDGYCCGRYASYWNAFLFFNVFIFLPSGGARWLGVNVTVRSRWTRYGH